MNILITGANGFLGKHFEEYYAGKDHKVFSLGRQQLDVSNTRAVEKFFHNNHIDVILHTAIKGGRRGIPDTFDNFVENILMFQNLSSHSDGIRLMINFGSGAEFDRRYPIKNAKEEEIHESLPADYYGLAKNLITREIKKHSHIINLRLFGCFGKHEHQTRFIKNSLRRIRYGAPIIISQDREMDFFYVGDLLKVVDHFIENGTSNMVDLNMCYETKSTLKTLAHEINVLTGASQDVIITDKNRAPCYTGSARRLGELNLDLQGLSAGLREMCNEYQ